MFSAKEISKYTSKPATKSGIFFQPKLTVNQPGDKYEQEADRMADQVMRMATPGAILRKCQHCEEEENQVVQREENGPSAEHRADRGVERYISGLDGRGRALSVGERNFFEPRFNRDFSDVRIHTDSQAAHSAQQINAMAYTVDNHIVFNNGLHQPHEAQGKRLMAHELTHVVQQAGMDTHVQRQLLPPVPIIVTPSTNRSVEINAVDDRQDTSMPWYYPPRYTGPLAGLLGGDVGMTDVNSMVDNIIAFLDGGKMHRLNIQDHGNASGVEIGDDWMASAADVAHHAAALARLRPHFTSNAFVHMQNCEAGQNQALICALAQALGVPVYAGTGLHNPIYGFNTGDYVSCSPSGDFNPDTGRPATPRAVDQSLEA